MTDRDLERFWSKVDRGGEDECWTWKGALFSTGYPQFWLDGTNVGGHRVMCSLHQDVASDECVLHSCDNPGCVNPGHLRPGTSADNSADMVARNRTRSGDRHPNRKLTSKDIPKIRRLHAAGNPTEEIGALFGVTGRAIRYVLRGQNWRHA